MLRQCTKYFRGLHCVAATAAATPRLRPPFNAPTPTAAAGCVCCRPVQAQCAPKEMQLIHKSVPTKPKLKSPPIVHTQSPPGGGQRQQQVRARCRCRRRLSLPILPFLSSPLFHCLPLSLFVCVSEWDGHSNSSSIGLDARLGGARNKSPGGGTIGSGGAEAV